MEHLYPEKEIDLTNSLDELRKHETTFLRPGQRSADTIVEERILGFKFSLIHSQHEMLFVFDDEYNTKINPNVILGSEDLNAVFIRFPGAGLARFRYAPFSEYTMKFVYFNKEIVKSLNVDYPQEGLFVTDVIPHAKGTPLDYELRNKFCNDMQLVAPPSRFNGKVEHIFSKLHILANTSEFGRNNSSGGIRILIEPRTDMISFIIKQTEKGKRELNIDTPSSLAEEVVGLVCNAKNVLEVFELTKKNPKTSPKRFLKSYFDWANQFMPGHFHAYYQRAKMQSPNLKKEEFDSLIMSYLQKKIKYLVSEMDRFKIQ